MLIAFFTIPPLRASETRFPSTRRKPPQLLVSSGGASLPPPPDFNPWRQDFSKNRPGKIV